MTNNSTDPSAKLGGAYSDRREFPRYAFIAAAEIIESTTDTHISGRISEISRRGCYIDVLNTLPKDTRITVSISTDNGTFQAPGHVIYVQERMGMGVAFDEPLGEDANILEGWLNELGR